MLVDYRTLRHKAKFIVMVDASKKDNECHVLIFSSFGSMMKFLRKFPEASVTIYNPKGKVKGRLKDRGLTLFL